MNQFTILAVEDDAPVRNLITTTLKAHNYNYLTAENGQSAILQVTSHNPEVMLLDLGLPDMDGVDLIKKIRTWSEMPIIVVSARQDEADKISALDAGADDYLTKPFSVDELLARIRVVQRRLQKQSDISGSSSIFINGGLKIDYVSNTIEVDGVEKMLTPIEFKLLNILAKNVGKVVTHSYLTTEIWGNNWSSSMASLRVSMGNLRKKIEKNTTDPVYIQTHVGIGYRMNQL
ncbi:two-component system, OmpR family, KDP operon response regulator KdpE [Oribacterium sp. KHPX15]|uniref:response regulator n=1 Tax=Oribacterium sp. KHPX15 TaxID=1855342 RepID=UPI000894C7EE|nr:response regulator transcription factor [Oribacterium sp. KHPX15]SEA61617.1 two-component system, OmpR family, KDP operon response regulator KdpE [Oribacterium sp. KHPX15]